MITDSSKIKSKWQISRIVETIRGKDGVLRGYKIKTGAWYVVEIPVQLVCDLKICGTQKTDQAKRKEADRTQATEVTANARPQRKAKSAAIDIIKGVSLNKLED